MMADQKDKNFANPGGINGLGKGYFNTNSEEFLVLQEMIQREYAQLSDAEKMKARLLSVRFQMESYLENSSEEIITTGQFLEKFLTAIGITKKRFSEYIGYTYSNLIALIKGRRKVNPELAVKFGKIFHINPVMWLQVESKNELRSFITQVPKSDLSLEQLLSSS